MISTVSPDITFRMVSSTSLWSLSWETNNVYKLYFYYYNALKGYDELVGYSTVNSH